uniref:S-adenosylmethionine sensor upstream of mTORC1 n=1 Tax=Timema genevievae TaxID=629358 RepID=A0A7R9JXI5_TIMGE|nr:unnamed protein product [Timema genevievae]
MTDEQHKKLAAFIKGVHHSLRASSHKVGVEKAWEEHCSQHDVLQQYATSMQELATMFWDVDLKGGREGTSRIQWVVKHCWRYFVHGDRRKETLRESRMEEQIYKNKPESEECCKFGQHYPSVCKAASGERLDDTFDSLFLLDVGSCYNPFKNFSFLKVLPVDLAPASPDVFSCDFLDLKVVSPSERSSILKTLTVSSRITQLPENSYHVVVFSLLLEYLPSPQQRFVCCKKAYDLLQDEGLLFIITPDFKQPLKNPVLMKSWRISLASIGFSRVYYEKLTHIQCMAYRKCPNAEVPRMWASRAITKKTPPVSVQDLVDNSDQEEQDPDEDQVHSRPKRNRKLPIWISCIQPSF